MSIKNAWRGLVGNLPTIEVEKVVEREAIVYGDAAPVTLYGASEYVYDGTYFYGRRKLTKYYATCEQAHAENPGREVATISAYRLGSLYILSRGTTEIEVVPKPKVTKGRK